MDKLKLLMGRPISVSEEHDLFVQQPLISDVVDMGEDSFNEYVLPYILTIDAIFGGLDNEEELMEKFTVYQLFFLNSEDGGFLDGIFGGKSALGVLEESIKYFLKTDDIQILENRKKIVINNSFLMDEVEFNFLRNIVQSVVGRKDIEVEKPPKNMTPRQKDIWDKLQKGRRRKAEREAIYLQDIINYTAFGGPTFIPLTQIDNMTYYQLHNAYKSVVGIDSYNTSLGYKLSQKFDVKDEIKHWTNILKIGK
ncbi:AMP-binding protein [Bacillus sp. S0628]|uniref:AMP-binding protein n=1 Tax=Bacillus sp. S0628 TaxID=2957802 RepID=UPI00209CD87C|nr:AMP-binding protein [Bacillus sp. S0628]MCP1324263.1 AMP-binding protein [Bacillus sp. S0628]